MCVGVANTALLEKSLRIEVGAAKEPRVQRGKALMAGCESNLGMDNEGLLKMISPAKSVGLVLRGMSKY